MSVSEKWFETKIVVNTDDLESACNILHMFLNSGFYIEDYSDIEKSVFEITHSDLIDRELLAKDKSICVIHVYFDVDPDEVISELNLAFKSQNIRCEISKSIVFQDDWANNWKKFYHSFKIVDKVVICPSWEDYTEKSDEVKILLDPDMAFGTGTHETTKLCAVALEKYLAPDKSVLDVGCGSGILSLIASKLGAEKICGVDVDPLSIKISAKNAKLNNLDNIKFIHSDLTDLVFEKYDIVIANIVADVIIKLVDDIDKYIYSNGIFICSGIIKSRESDVKCKLLNKNFEIVERYEDNDWVCFISKVC